MIKTNFVIQQITGFFVQAPADPMSAEVLDDFISSLFGFFFYDQTHVTDFHTTLDHADGFFQYFFRGVYVGLMPKQIISKNKRTSIVRPKTI